LNASRTILSAGVAFAALASIPAAAQAACTNLLETPAGITIDYDPLSASDTVKTFTVRQRNDCNNPRGLRTGVANFGYWGDLPTPGRTPATSLDIPILVDGPTGDTLNLTQSNRDALIQQNFQTRQPGQARQAEVTLTVPRGYNVKRRDRQFDLYAIGEEQRQNGDVEAIYQVIPVTVNTIRSVSMSLPGASTSTTLDFGTLTTGDRKGVNVQIRSTTPFKVSMTSDNKGVLGLVGDTGNTRTKRWTIPYTAELDGVTISENTPVTSNAPSGPLAAPASWRFRVTIGDVAGARAGIYRDVITLKVSPL